MRKVKFSKNQKMIDYILTNSRHLTCSAMAHKLNVSTYVIKTICENHNIKFIQDGEYNPYKVVADDFGSIPEDSKLHLWDKGIVLTYPVSDAGFLSITRHFSDIADKNND